MKEVILTTIFRISSKSQMKSKRISLHFQHSSLILPHCLESGLIFFFFFFFMYPNFPLCFSVLTLLLQEIFFIGLLFLYFFKLAFKSRPVSLFSEIHGF